MTTDLQSPARAEMDASSANDADANNYEDKSWDPCVKQMHTQQAQFNEYWELASYKGISTCQLAAKASTLGYADHTTRPTLVKIMHRAEKQLVCYDACTTQELQKFARARRLPGSWKRSLLERRLKAADGEATFPRFLDLPAELRNRVYQMYVAEFPVEGLRTPAQPPITRCCRLLRQEALPVFYGSCTFVLNFAHHEVVPTWQRDTGRLLKAAPDTSLFLETLSVASAQEIRRVEFRLREQHSGRYQGEEFCRCVVSLDGSEKGYVIEATAIFERGRELGDVADAEEARVERTVGEVVERVQVTEGRRKFEVADIYAMRVALEKLYS